MKKILIVEGRRTIGGGQVMTRKIACALSQNNDVTVFIPNKESSISKYLGDFKQCKFPFLEYNRGKKTILDIFRFIKNVLLAAFCMYRCVKGSQIDIIYVQSPSMVPVASLIGSLTGRKVIAHLHVVHSDVKSRRALNYFLGYKCVIRIVGVSQYALSQLTSKNKIKSTVIYNCIDFEDRVTSKELSEPYRFAVIGDILPAKGQLIAAQAVSVLPFDTHLILVGAIVDDNYVGQIKECFPKAEFTGHIENVKEIIDSVDIVIISSTAETFSLSMVEAWSKGVPTVASNYGGMRELVEELLPQYADVLLFERSNSDQLRAKIENLLANKELDVQISKTVVDVARREFSFSAFSQQINDITL